MELFEKVPKRYICAGGGRWSEAFSPGYRKPWYTRNWLDCGNELDLKTNSTSARLWGPLNYPVVFLGIDKIRASPPRMPTISHRRYARRVSLGGRLVRPASEDKGKDIREEKPVGAYGGEEEKHLVLLTKALVQFQHGKISFAGAEKNMEVYLKTVRRNGLRLSYESVQVYLTLCAYNDIHFSHLSRTINLFTTVAQEAKGACGRECQAKLTTSQEGDNLGGKDRRGRINKPVSHKEGEKMVQQTVIQHRGLEESETKGDFQKKDFAEEKCYQPLYNYKELYDGTRKIDFLFQCVVAYPKLMREFTYFQYLFADLLDEEASQISQAVYVQQAGGNLTGKNIRDDQKMCSSVQNKKYCDNIYKSDIYRLWRICALSGISDVEILEQVIGCMTHIVKLSDEKSFNEDENELRTRKSANLLSLTEEIVEFLSPLDIICDEKMLFDHLKGLFATMIQDEISSFLRLLLRISTSQQMSPIQKSRSEICSAVFTSQISPAESLELSQPQSNHSERMNFYLFNPGLRLVAELLMKGDDCFKNSLRDYCANMLILSVGNEKDSISALKNLSLYVKEGFWTDSLHHLSPADPTILQSFLVPPSHWSTLFNPLMVSKASHVVFESLRKTPLLHMNFLLKCTQVNLGKNEKNGPQKCGLGNNAAHEKARNVASWGDVASCAEVKGVVGSPSGDVKNKGELMGNREKSEVLMEKSILPFHITLNLCERYMMPLLRTATFEPQNLSPLPMYANLGFFADFSGVPSVVPQVFSARKECHSEGFKRIVERSTIWSMVCRKGEVEKLWRINEEIVRLIDIHFINLPAQVYLHYAILSNNMNPRMFTLDWNSPEHVSNHLIRRNHNFLAERILYVCQTLIARGFFPSQIPEGISRTIPYISQSNFEFVEKHLGGEYIAQMPNSTSDSRNRFLAPLDLEAFLTNGDNLLEADCLKMVPISYLPQILSNVAKCAINYDSLLSDRSVTATLSHINHRLHLDVRRTIENGTSESRFLGWNSNSPLCTYTSELAISDLGRIAEQIAFANPKHLQPNSQERHICSDFPKNNSDNSLISLHNLNLPQLLLLQSLLSMQNNALEGLEGGLFPQEKKSPLLRKSPSVFQVDVALCVKMTTRFVSDQCTYTASHSLQKEQTSPLSHTVQSLPTPQPSFSSQVPDLANYPSPYVTEKVAKICPPTPEEPGTGQSCREKFAKFPETISQIENRNQHPKIDIENFISLLRLLWASIASDPILASNKVGGKEKFPAHNANLPTEYLQNFRSLTDVLLISLLSLKRPPTNKGEEGREPIKISENIIKDEKHAPKIEKYSKIEHNSGRNNKDFENVLLFWEKTALKNSKETNLWKQILRRRRIQAKTDPKINVSKNPPHHQNKSEQISGISFVEGGGLLRPTFMAAQLVRYLDKRDSSQGEIEPENMQKVTEFIREKFGEKIDGDRTSESQILREKGNERETQKKNAENSRKFLKKKYENWYNITPPAVSHLAQVQQLLEIMNEILQKEEKLKILIKAELANRQNKESFLPPSGHSVTNFSEFLKTRKEEEMSEVLRRSVLLNNGVFGNSEICAHMWKQIKWCKNSTSESVRTAENIFLRDYLPGNNGHLRVYEESQFLFSVDLKLKNYDAFLHAEKNACENTLPNQLANATDLTQLIPTQITPNGADCLDLYITHTHLYFFCPLKPQASFLLPSLYSLLAYSPP